MVELTRRQGEVLTAIRDMAARAGYPPTMRELCDALGVNSTNSLCEHLDRLERKKGVIRRGAMTARSIVITQAGHAWLADNAPPLPPAPPDPPLEAA